MQLPISMPGLGHVNTYALEDDRGFALVDPGLPGPESWEALMQRLATAGIPLKRVHTTIVTHSHPDHFGGADQLAEEAGADILTHESFRSLVTETNDDIDMDLLEANEEELVEIWKRRFASFEPTPWGTTREPPPDDAIRRWIVMGEGGHKRFRGPDPTIRVADNEVVRLANRDWFAVHTPGHTMDHLCLFDPEEGVLLAGDHVLPTITPHIAGTSDVEDPLATFFASLDKVAALDGLTCALPAHGHPFEDLSGRCTQIRHHHDDRLQLLRDAADANVDAPVQAWMKVLFKERSWGEMAASETYAHLEHLRVIGEASTRRDDNGHVRFSLPTE
ncbi:MAG: glyoxylase-like metal-dependent hydrolase (beta-lactamase superfamily II) [Candidatus Aldehydirespiratoraceae bacterium]|jgi:glyoxylase-like metal-dependent hydrolase (beta-lactamase superfamily II)